MSAGAQQRTFDRDNLSRQYADELRRLQVSQRESKNADQGDESRLLTSCDLYRQVKVETLKTEQNTISELTVKEKQLRTH